MFRYIRCQDSVTCCQSWSIFLKLVDLKHAHLRSVVFIAAINIVYKTMHIRDASDASY